MHKGWQRSSHSILPSAQRWQGLCSDDRITAEQRSSRLNGDERREFLAEMERLTTSRAALKSSRATAVKWCQPRLRVRVKHLAGSKALRHATVRALVDPRPFDL